MRRYVLFLLLATALTGCFGQRPHTTSWEAERLKAQTLLNQFEESIAKHDCYEAENYKAQLFSTALFSSNQVKAILLTKLCLCYLESEGNVQVFSGCASELKDISQDLTHLRKETQFVLELGSYISEGRPSEDPRVSPEIRDALAIVFQGGE